MMHTLLGVDEVGVGVGVELVGGGVDEDDGGGVMNDGGGESLGWAELVVPPAGVVAPAACVRDGVELVWAADVDAPPVGTDAAG